MWVNVLIYCAQYPFFLTMVCSCYASTLCMCVLSRVRATVSFGLSVLFGVFMYFLRFFFILFREFTWCMDQLYVICDFFSIFITRPLCDKNYNRIKRICSAICSFLFDCFDQVSTSRVQRKINCLPFERRQLTGLSFTFVRRKGVSNWKILIHQYVYLRLHHSASWPSFLSATGMLLFCIFC